MDTLQALRALVVLAQARARSLDVYAADASGFRQDIQHAQAEVLRDLAELIDEVLDAEEG